MDAAKLPEMEDAALAVLHENAERLERSGTKSQQAAATALMPAIEAELATRRAAKLAQARESRRGEAGSQARGPEEDRQAQSLLSLPERGRPGQCASIALGARSGRGAARRCGDRRHSA